MTPVSRILAAARGLAIAAVLVTAAHAQAQNNPIAGPTTVNNTVPINQALTGGAQDAFTSLLVPGDLAISGSTVYNQANGAELPIMPDLDDRAQKQYESATLTWAKMKDYRQQGLTNSLADAPALLNGSSTPALGTRQHPLVILIGYLTPTLYGFFFYLALIFAAISAVVLIKDGRMDQWLDKAGGWIGLTVACAIIAFLAA